jgi:hypothetical protein
MALLEKTGLYGVPYHICRDDRTMHSKTGRLVILLYNDKGHVTIMQK